MVFGAPAAPLPLIEGTDMASAEERVAHVAECLPEICTLDCGTMNFAEADYVMTNTPGMLQAMGGMMSELGVKPEVEAFDSGHLWYAQRLVADGILKEPALVQLCMGVPWGAPDDLNTFMAMVNNVPAGWTWSAFSLGRNEMPYVAAAVLAGGNVRVGLEDNLWLAKGELATNEALVSRARTIIEAMVPEGHRPGRGARTPRPHQASASMKAAIIGGGVIGGGWAARFLLNGWDVSVYDPGADAERKVEEVVANARRSLPALYETALPPEGKLRFTSDLPETVHGADWIQESVPERLELKHKVLSEILEHAPDDALIASSTSGFKPSELNRAGAGPRRARVLVAHPFNPVYLLPLVELVGDEAALSSASETLQKIGMKPLVVRQEIDAHIADRFLEAVWREALWLVKDDIATTEEIDDAIRFGFGLRWAQMGLFETYRTAGGEGGMAHFIAQFGPCLAWPWTRLTDVPELTDDLVRKIADQSDAQSGSRSIRELEQKRDDNLVAIMRALKGRDWGAGAVLNRHDAELRSQVSGMSGNIRTVERVVPIDWTDYNGHMNESRYGQVFSDAADAVMAMIGADADYVASGLSYFTVDTHTRFKLECHAGDPVHVDTTLLEGAGKKLRLFHEMKAADGTVLADCEQLLIHVSLETRRSCEPAPALAVKLAQLLAEGGS